MTLPYPHFQLNFKIYPETWGDNALSVARDLERLEAETDAQFVITPQLPDVRMLAENTDIAVTAPFMHATEPGRGMGKILADTLADAGVDGVVHNHAENRDTLTDLVWKIERCQDLGIDSVVCVDSIEMGRSIAHFDPDLLIYEMPEDIASEAAITKTNPDRVRDFLAMVEGENPRTRVLVGGGISTPEDVRLAFELGADASGAASAVSLADERESLLERIAGVFP